MRRIVRRPSLGRPAFGRPSRSGPDGYSLRLGVLGVVVLSLFATLLARLWYLQVLAAPDLADEAKLNSVRLVATEAPRGRILDRAGRVLVDNRVVAAVVVDRQQAARDTTLLPRLADVLKLPLIELQRRMSDVRFTQYKPVPVAEDVPKELVVFLREYAEEFGGVSVEQVAQRTFPNGTLAAHILGYVGEINDSELAARRGQGYRAGDSIGKLGVELAYEHVLRGSAQVEKLQVDSTDHVLRTLGLQPGVPGRDIQLTIDLDVQRVAEQALEEGLMAARKAWDPERLKHFIAPAGAVVVMDPRDGSILAMASYPTYDPDDFANGISVARFAELNDPAGHYPLNNRAIQGLYAPGSTFKMVTALAGLEQGVIAPHSSYTDTGRYEVGNPPIVLRNAGGIANGRIDLAAALTVSSDVYFYWLGEEFEKRGNYGIQGVARDLGLGRVTGVELPYEAGGRIADPDVKRKLHMDNPEAFTEGEWYTGDNLNMAVGQGDTVVTPLELASAYATFANGGTVYTPHLGAAVRDPVSGAVSPIQAQAQRRLAWNPANRDAVMSGLARVVSAESGTAYNAFAGFPLSRFPVAGKTGTAEVFGKQDTALFSAFGPVGDPRYVVTVVMEESGRGAAAAAPVARRVFDSLVGNPTQPVARVAGRD